MIYVLKNKDMDVLKFEVVSNLRDPEVNIVWVSQDQKALLPLDLKASNDSLARWLKNRTIPRNRAFVNAFLAKCGLSINRPMDIISVSKGLSLNDCFWVVPEDFDGTFEANNLYDNPFNTILSYIAFTGTGSSTRTSLHSSPEFTTNGMLPKCWRRLKGKVMLFKGGTTGAANTGNEPYSEFYAAQIAKQMGINHVPYSLGKWKGIICSVCELFTSKDYSYIPIGRFVTSGGFQAVVEYYLNLGDRFYNEFVDMIVFDAVVCNTDRHYGNFGFLVDNNTNQIAAPAPLFDHGNALFNLAGMACWMDEKELEEYIAALQPAVYDDFIGTAKELMKDRQREMLRHLLTFQFEPHHTYNLPARRRKMIEKQIQKRARQLLD